MTRDILIQSDNKNMYGEKGSAQAKSGDTALSTVKERLKAIIDDQPDDASYEEILRELAFERMVERGMEDSRAGRVLSDEEMEHRIRSW